MKNRSLKTGLRYVRRAPYQAIAVVLVMAVTFFVTSVIVLVVFGSNRLLGYFESRPQVIAFLKTDASEANQNSLKDNLSNDARVRDVHVVTKEDAFNIYKNATSDNPLLGELVSPSIFPSSVEFSLNDLGDAETIISEVKKNDFVDTVGFTANLGGEAKLGDTISRLKSVAQSIRIGGVVAVAVLIGTSFIVLLVVMTMRVSMRKSEIESMSLLGATGAFIRAPIVIEAIVYSLLGVFFGWFLSFLLVLYASPAMLDYFKQIEVLPRQLPELLKLLGLILSGEIVVGIIIALFGAFAAVARSLRMIQ